MLKIYNSLNNKKEIFKPRKDKQVDMFVCGITPYDSPHIGNFRVAINYDVMARYLRHYGYNVFYLQNVTDIDDKIIKASREKNMPWQELAEHYFKEHIEVSKRLNIKSISKYAKATRPSPHGERQDGSSCFAAFHKTKSYGCFLFASSSSRVDLCSFAKF